MDGLPDLLRAFVALAIVIVLMIVIAQLIRRMPGWQKYLGVAAGKRIETVASHMLDARHRIVIVKIDERERSFLLSPESAMEIKP